MTTLPRPSEYPYKQAYNVAPSSDLDSGTIIAYVRDSGSIEFNRPTQPIASDDRASYEQLRKRFADLTHRWKDDTAPVSSVRQIASHPAYREIIRMGRSIVPLILEDLEKSSADWFFALNAITGENPIHDGDEGHLPKMVDAWITWGHSKGYISGVHNDVFSHVAA